MTRTLVAILALSPVLAFAQTNQPAQPRSTPLLASTLVQPADLHAAVVADRAASPASIPVSTGISAPQIIRTASFIAPQDAISRHFNGIERTVVVQMTVDEAGKPTDLSVVRSAGAAIDHQVLATVGQYRYQPGTLNGQAIAVAVKLEVTIPAGTTY